MAKSAYVIRFPPDASAALVHRVLNCVEDIDRQFRDSGFGEIEPRDDYGSGTFFVRSRSARLSGDAMSVVKHQLENHGLEAVSEVVRVPNASKHVS